MHTINTMRNAITVQENRSQQTSAPTPVPSNRRPGGEDEEEAKRWKGAHGRATSIPLPARPLLDAHRPSASESFAPDRDCIRPRERRDGGGMVILMVHNHRSLATLASPGRQGLCFTLSSWGRFHHPTGRGGERAGCEETRFAPRAQVRFGARDTHTPLPPCTKAACTRPSRQPLTFASATFE